MPLNWLPLHYFVSEANMIINRPNHKHTSHTGIQIIHIDMHKPYVLRILFLSDTVIFDLSSFPQHLQFFDWLFLLMMPHHVSFPDAIFLAFKNIARSSVSCSVSSVKHPCSYLHRLKWWFFESPSVSFPYITCNISCISINQMNRVSSIFSL